MGIINIGCRNKTSNFFIIYIGPNVAYIIHNFITPIFMRLYNWSNTVLFQISHYTGFHIKKKLYYWAWIYLQPCSCSLQFYNFGMLSWLVCIWLRWRINLQSAMCLFRIITLRKNINWPRVCPFNLFIVEITVNNATAKIPNHMSLLSIVISLMLYFHTRLPITEWIYSNIT